MKDDSVRPTPAELLQYRKPNEEEINVYKNCMSGAVVKAGVPFAVGSYLIASMLRKPGSGAEKRSLLMHCLIFFSNAAIGTFLYSPVCYSKFSNLFYENIKKEKGEEGTDALSLGPQTEGIQSPSRIEDFSYPTDAISQLNEPDGNFSTDFNYTKLVDDDSLDSAGKTHQNTTYSDLRARHRSEQAKAYTSPVAPNIDYRQPLSPPYKAEEGKEPPTVPQRRVVRNKYGDEME